jgi:Tol biopolymer transport system component
VTRTPGQNHGGSWSPDGRWLRFTGAPFGGDPYDILAVPVEGGDVIPIVATDRDERTGTWAQR